MPSDHLDILRVIHQDREALELAALARCGRKTGQPSVFASQVDTDKPSQTHTLLSRPHVAISLPSWLHATLLHSFSWPSSESIVSHSSSSSSPETICEPSSMPCSRTRCQMPMVASKDAVASVFPLGLKASARTVRECVVGMDALKENLGKVGELALAWALSSGNGV